MADKLAKKRNALDMLLGVATKLDDIADREQKALDTLEERGFPVDMTDVKYPEEQRTMAENIRVAVEALS